MVCPSAGRCHPCCPSPAAQLCHLWVSVAVDLEPSMGRFVAQQCREPLKGDLANSEGILQGNNHIFDNFLATSLHFCRAASAALRGLVAALGHQGGRSDPSPALGMWSHLGNGGQLAIREPRALMRNCEPFQTTLIPTNL